MFWPVVKEISFKDISYLQLAALLFTRAEPILLEGLMRNTSVKLFGRSGSEGNAV